MIGISDVDIRELTRRLRTHGAQNACLMAGDNIYEAQVIQAAKKHPPMTGQALAEQVSIKEISAYNQEAGCEDCYN